MSSKQFQRAALRLQARVTCPHCWHVFPPHETLWVSQHPDLLGDARLGKEQQLRFLPTRFTVDGDAIDPRGFSCQTIACPNCHLNIPRALLEMEPLFFSILGAPASGKSYFLSSMTWQLRKALPRHFAIAFGDADPSANLTLNGYEEQLFLNADPDSLTALPKTQLEGADLYDSVQFSEQVVIFPRPYVFSLRPLHGHQHYDLMDRVSRALCLYDNAGEHFMPGQDRVGSPVTRHLALSRALFFLFDPTQDPDFRRACSATSKDPQVTDKARTYRQELVLLEAAERVRRHAGLGQSAQHDRPLIVIVTKFDTWRGLLGDNNLQLSFEQVARRLNDHVSALDLTTIEKVSRSVRQMLMKYRSEFVSAAESFCKEVVYVPVSALGCSPEVDPNGMLCVRSRNIKPMWVEIPMCYALARWVPGLIPSGRRAGSNGQHPFVAEGQTAAQGRAPSPSNRHQ